MNSIYLFLNLISFCSKIDLTVNKLIYLLFSFYSLLNILLLHLINFSTKFLYLFLNLAIIYFLLKNDSWYN